ncbi:DNA repair protein RecN [Mangrovitalea sediminis]|uniref:DNA repair protein RecN n=1 Tax=Mangrovitalea sediminis TaxID=1982043 RepID=UPI000BE61BD9|nr:DNA repair protein RecN [Mangrovitalea sediminis]
MLTQLTVSNYAIADRLELQFDKGMTALTGETGAGKSIVLGALSLSLGDRADAAVVREGAKRADITAVFDIRDNEAASTWLQKHDLDADNDCILRRVISRDGRSRAYINGQPCPLQDLRQLGSLLMDIHSQHQHQSLLQRDNHRRLLDEFAGAETLAEETLTTYKQWKQLQERLDTARNCQEESNARLQLLRYQVEELERLDLQPSELSELENEQQQLSNAEQILKQSHLAAQFCAEDDSSAAYLVRQAIQQLEQLPVEVIALTDTLQMLNEAHIQLNEAGNNLRHFIDGYELDPERLSVVEERLSAIYQLARKHRIQPEELPALRETLHRELSELDGGADSQEQLEIELSNRLEHYQTIARQLSEQRQQAAAELDMRVAEELHRLNMANAQFVTRLTKHSDGTPHPHGNEDIEFLVSANAGQPARSLAKVASGGELSRISLAIQVVVAQTSTIPSLVFDEVDVGIGGGTAEVVGRLLRILGESGQVLCVTHLPQVAAQAHQHLFVSKFSENDATFSRVEKLDDQRRVQEVARMLGGVDVTDQSLAHAREMYGKGQATHH